MSEKLILKKRGEDYFLLSRTDNSESVVATLEGGDFELTLILSNCKDIERGYDLDELAIKMYPPNNCFGQTSVEQNIRRKAFKKGVSYRDEMLLHENPKPDPALIESMCLRYRHDFGLISDEHIKNGIRSIMYQLWEEVVGVGFYKGASEWEVEIVTEPMSLDEIREQGKGFLNANLNKYKKDALGRIFLKRK